MVSIFQWTFKEPLTLKTRFSLTEVSYLVGINDYSLTPRKSHPDSYL